MDPSPHRPRGPAGSRRSLAGRFRELPGRLRRLPRGPGFPPHGPAAPPPPWEPARWRNPRGWAHGSGPRHVAWLTSFAVLVAQQAGSQGAAANQEGVRTSLDVYARLLLTVGPLLLLVRYRYPRTAVFGCAVATTVYLAAGYPYGPVFLSVAVAAFAAVVAGHRYAAWGALVLVWAGHLVFGYVLLDRLPPAGDQPPGWQSELLVAAWIAAVLAVGELARTRRQEWARRRAEAEAAERRRVDEERLRIARELHDVLAHSISVINVQAGVGLALLDSDREQARTALTTIKNASKEALGEVRQVLDTLRAPGDAPRAPAPGLGRLPELVSQAADAGLRVTTETEGEATSLPPGADLAAFRIVQEALTNVVRHSESRTARVRLSYGHGELRIDVDDEGPATGAGAGGGGNGLVGMRERAAALGGSAEAGPRADGGFRVTARLPLAGGGSVSAPPAKESP
ncbi:sensor histidine kinase [Streptomyces sp. HNM0575]|uniref:sensor histidine kinase n=1 Tax=Streptomyces sp. HNM0575 TaxID=2716338 RepID=UPI00145CE25E|nr:sensor histidine kinase [Streptomyces sp. HNM0575]NLU73592.1 sensor histidine kinase [Streptomyces sp. HNM0575]